MALPPQTNDCVVCEHWAEDKFQVEVGVCGLAPNAGQGAGRLAVPFVGPCEYFTPLKTLVKAYDRIKYWY